MHTLGPIIRLQIQRSRLKVGDKPHRTYTTDALVAVERSRLDRDGIVASHQGQDVLDVHHTGHPDTRNQDRLNGISIGFTSHYDAMRDRFGDHMALGVAGENLIVETDRPIAIDEIAGGLVVLDRTGRQKLALSGIQVAVPCRPFAGFALAGKVVEPEVLKETLRFLHNGMRGYYAIIEGVAEIELGDVVGVA